MLMQTGRKPSKQRLVLMAAGSLLVAAGAGLTLFAEQPAEASEHFEALSSPDGSFDQAFTRYEMDEQDAAPAAASVAAAEARFAAAPVEEPGEVVETGNASYYGAKFAGRRTASGETFDPTDLTAAHRSLPFGTRVKVTNQLNGRSVVVRINDRGPYHGNRLIDLSREAAQRIGIVGPGHGRVDLALYSS